MDTLIKIINIHVITACLSPPSFIMFQGTPAKLPKATIIFLNSYLVVIKNW